MIHPRAPCQILDFIMLWGAALNSDINFQPALLLIRIFEIVAWECLKSGVGHNWEQQKVSAEKPGKSQPDQLYTYVPLAIAILYFQKFAPTQYAGCMQKNCHDT